MLWERTNDTPLLRLIRGIWRVWPAQALRLHGGIPSGRHGAILAAKLVLVVGMMVLAALVRGGLQRGVAANRGALHRLALTEIGSGAAILGLSAALVLTSPT
jgi:hypothetical protein